MEASSASGETGCVVCGAETSKSCGKCKKVYYCSKEHQVAHRKDHKEDCYPGKIIKDDTLGHHLVATRLIRTGEIIFKEKPLLLAPNGKLKNLKKICLACCDLVKDCTTCSKCHWPVCNSVCENDPRHAKFECSILADNKIPKPKNPNEFEVIAPIRGVLYKLQKPEKWKKLTTMMPYRCVKFPLSRPQLQNTALQICTFLTKTCKMRDLSFSTVRLVCDIVNKSAYIPARTANRIGIQFYHKTSKISLECVPNVRVYDEEPELVAGGDAGKVQRKPLYQVKVMATKDIQPGEIFKQFFGDSVLGTLERRGYLQDEYFFSCLCKRCTDPTELGSYLSAVKCTSDECLGVDEGNNGYYLPVHPTHEEALWQCNRCQEEAPYLDHIFHIIARVSDAASAALADVKKCNDLQNGSGLLKAVLRVDGMLKCHSGVVVHKNHYMLIPLKIQFLSQVYNFLSQIDCETKLYTVLSHRMTELATEVLEVIDAIFPGMTVIRGKILFYLTTGRWYTMKRNIIKGEDYLEFLPAVEDLSKIKEEAQSILHLEPLESIENAMGNALGNIDMFRSKYSSSLLKQELRKLRVS